MFLGGFFFFIYFTIILFKEMIKRMKGSKWIDIYSSIHIGILLISPKPYTQMKKELYFLKNV